MSAAGVLQPLWRFLAARKSRISLAPGVVREVIDRHGAEQWFFYAFSSRAKRWHVCEPSLWVAWHLPKGSALFETGCGCGLNLIWFAQQGFTNLKGSDLSAAAVAAGRDLARLARAPVELWQDDALAPGRLPERVDAVLALNWTYHAAAFDLAVFLTRYANTIGERGFLVIDVIDAAYDKAENNRYLTSDWGKPVEERAPSEYTKRYSADFVYRTAAAAGFDICRTMSHEGETVPRVVYIMRKR